MESETMGGAPIDALSPSLEVESDPMDLFRAALKSEVTSKSYPRWLDYFLKFAGTDAKSFLARAKKDPKWAEGRLLAYVLHLRKQGKAAATIRTYLAPVTLYLEMGDVAGVNWKRIGRTVPALARSGDDRAPTLEEVRAIAGDTDFRVRVGVLAMASGGLRVGAFDGMTVKHVEPIKKDGEIAAARVRVYPQAREEYQALISPEAWGAFEFYLSHRRENGEKVGPDSPVLRNRYRDGKAGHGVRALDTSTLQGILHRRSLRLGLRKGNGRGRYEFSTSHAFRKFFKSQAEAAGMKSLLVERLLGHETGLQGRYFKPREEEMLAEYLKALPRLTILTVAAPVEESERVKALEERLAVLESKETKHAEGLLERLFCDPIIRKRALALLGTEAP